MINHGWSASKAMNRWPTVPVAPRMPTLTVWVFTSGSQEGGAAIFGGENWGGDDFDLVIVVQYKYRSVSNEHRHHLTSNSPPSSTPTTKAQYTSTEMDPNAPDSDQQQQLYYPPHILVNQSRIYSTKFLTSCFAGAAAGILGLENFRGFAVFLFATLFSSALLWSRCKGLPKKYLPGGWMELVNPGQENLFSFLLVWTLFYGTLSFLNYYCPPGY